MLLYIKKQWEREVKFPYITREEPEGSNFNILTDYLQGFNKKWGRKSWCDLGKKKKNLGFLKQST